MASVTRKPLSTVKGFFYDLKTWPKHTASSSGSSGSTTLSHCTWRQMEATEFITKGRKNTFPMTQSGPKIKLVFQITQWEGCTLPWCNQDQDSKDKTCNTTDAVTNGGRIPPLLLRSHLWNMIVISKLTLTRVKQKAQVTITHNSIGFFQWE